MKDLEKTPKSTCKYCTKMMFAQRNCHIVHAGKKALIKLTSLASLLVHEVVDKR